MVTDISMKSLDEEVGMHSSLTNADLEAHLSEMADVRLQSDTWVPGDVR